MCSSDLNWATTADAYAAGRFINPRNAALLYVGFTGQPDYLKPAVPEMLAVLAPLKHEEGRLLVDQDEVLVRSLTSAGRGDGSAPPVPFARQFNYQHERYFMYAAQCAAAQYLAALNGHCSDSDPVAATTFPVPQLCQMVRRGTPNQDGVMPAPTPVPFARLADHEIDPAAFVVLDVNTLDEGVDILGVKPVLVPQTCTWRMRDGHVRSIFHRYGEGAPGEQDMSPTIDAWYSVR